MDRLEDLVWKLYDELDGKIQGLFQEQNERFKQQNNIISNIFRGFSEEIGGIKHELGLEQEIQGVEYQNTESQHCSEAEGEGEISPDHQRYQPTAVMAVNEDQHYQTTNNERYPVDTLEEVIEEASKGISFC